MNVWKQLDSMPSWLKALVVLAALMVGLPSVASAHPAHRHGVQIPVETEPIHAGSPPKQVLKFGHESMPAVMASAFERLNNGEAGGLGPCCCQSAVSLCAPSPSGSSLGGIETMWDLAALVRRSKVIRAPEDTRDYAGPYFQLDRPPKT